MIDIKSNLTQVQQRIDDAVKRSHRDSRDISLIAVSKTQSVDAIRTAYAAGQRHFAENYLQHALDKMQQIHEPGLVWHFIGAIQSNKTRAITEHFDWVHSVDRLKIAQRLAEQRPAHLPPLNVCLQINISNEASKSGLTLEQLPEIAVAVNQLPHIRLRGLMAIPAHTTDTHLQRQYFRQMRQALEQLKAQGLALDTLSMGMSNDLEAAIAEGATMLRIGTAIFGPRLKT